MFSLYRAALILVTKRLLYAKFERCDERGKIQKITTQKHAASLPPSYEDLRHNAACMNVIDRKG